MISQSKTKPEETTPMPLAAGSISFGQSCDRAEDPADQTAPRLSVELKIPAIDHPQTCCGKSSLCFNEPDINPNRAANTKSP